jgi:chromosome segregation protein
LTKLELHGFKSFADSTSLVFEPGVTAIVGPNGCGKSNVSDAVRWVLGEQRARLLRGAKMEEVIFQGSSARRAVNIAEVSLHFENDDGSLAVPFREVVITRRLSRSGESDYFLNRAPCRLRDIHDMVRGTGLGADSGVVIESKMIDALLSDRPDDRRELFEEAAGVGLYRDRRRTTERRLEETAVDLQRLDDLISEVQSQVRSLARQRKRAERHSELISRRFTVEMALAAREMASWREELERIEARLDALRAEAPAAESVVRSAEDARDSAHSARSVAEGQRAELARLVSALQQRALELRREMAVAEERQKNASARRERAEEERRAGAAHGERLAAERAASAAERERLSAEVEQARRDADRAGALEEEARSKVTHARTMLEAAEQAALSVHERSRTLRFESERALREQQEIAQRIVTGEAERQNAADHIASLDREIAAVEDEIAGARERATAAAAAHDSAQAEAQNAREIESAARGQLFRADEALTTLAGKVHALEGLERERVGLAPAAAKLLREREQFGEGAVLGPLSDFIHADAAAAMMVERFLGPTVHAVVIRDTVTAGEIRRWHAEVHPGPLLLLPLDSLRHHNGGRNSGLANAVDTTGAGSDWVRALLGGVEPVDGGSAFTDVHGAIWLPGTHGGPGPLRRRAELYALRSDLTTRESARSKASAESERARHRLDEAERGVVSASDAVAVSQHALRQASERREDLERQRQRALRELEEATTQLGRMRARVEAIGDELRGHDAQVATLAGELAERDRGIADAQAAVAAATRAQDDAREQRTQRQIEQAQADARLQVAMDRERRLGEEEMSATARLAALQAELSDLSQADGLLASQMSGWELDLSAREGMLRDAEARLAAAEASVRDSDTALETAEHALDQARRRATAAADELHHAELRFSELSGRRSAIRERLETEWKRPIEELLASAEPVDLDEEALRTEVESLRAQLDALGPVNVLAIEEHDESVKRLDFLESQRADLHSAKLSLTQAIREIDATARDLFLTTFTAVRENFRQIFMTLFGGGECDLRLENPEAPLDCDIEIHASPRGKRTQRIHLLSSGERALVALSLLFGLFLTKPSPFCLLDEVDAPLDDANIGRFVRMLNQFKSRTQFIVITHNPRTTTEAADAVYGVTMQEPGVSSLVSVRMRGNAIEDAIAGPGRADAPLADGVMGGQPVTVPKAAAPAAAPA